MWRPGSAVAKRCFILSSRRQELDPLAGLKGLDPMMVGIQAHQRGAGLRL